MTNAKHYREAWENQDVFKGWLTKNSAELIAAGHGEARCKFCKTSLRAHASDLKKHAITDSHRRQARSWNRKEQPSLTSHINSSQKKDLKIAELKMVLYTAAHSSVRSIDHLGEVLKDLGKGSQLEKLRLHRTKASKLILNVVAPVMLEELISDIGEQDFSIILDESTDVSTIKYMAYCVRYFSRSQDQFVTDFLGFDEVFSATAESLYKNFKDFLTKVGLNIKKLVAIGTDGANNMCGVRHSLFTLIRKDYPYVQLMKCSCHSLSLCASKASDELPASVEFLLRESRTWFSRSPLRQTTYKNLYEKLSHGKKPAKLVQLSDTRWLACTNAVTVVLKQWDALKSFFIQLEASQTNKCVIARNLGQMYRDDSNLLYLIFLDTVLKEVTDLNIAFQKANADITKLYSELRILLLSVARRIFKPIYLKPIAPKTASTAMLHEADIAAVKGALLKANSEFGDSLLPLESVDFGTNFSSYASKETIPTDSLTAVKLRSRTFMVKLCEELVKRFPANVAVLSNLRFFTPKTCMDQTTNLSVECLPWDLAANDINKDAIEAQWRMLRSIRIDEICESRPENKSVSTVGFWIAVDKIESADGSKTFKDLAGFALRALSLPTSNADVERVFSVMAVIKTKLRNRMLIPMLVALMRVRIHMRVFKICCKDYTPSVQMLKRFTSQMYQKQDQNRIMIDNNKSDDDNDDDLIEAMNLIDYAEDNTDNCDLMND